MYRSTYSALYFCWLADGGEGSGIIIFTDRLNIFKLKCDTRLHVKCTTIFHPNNVVTFLLWMMSAFIQTYRHFHQHGSGSSEYMQIFLWQPAFILLDRVKCTRAASFLPPQLLEYCFSAVLCYTFHIKQGSFFSWIFQRRVCSRAFTW